VGDRRGVARTSSTAHDFINFATEPERQARMPQYIAYGTTVHAASDHVAEDYRADLPTTPENLEVAIEFDTEFWVDNIERLN
jgi:putative spermidine/putrescine transport system substrate-binding protein